MKAPGLSFPAGSSRGRVCTRFERFTERARQVPLSWPQEDEARILKHKYIGTEQILLGP